MSAKRPRLKKVERESVAVVPEQIEKLKELFPEAASEGKVDFNKLRQTLGDEVDAGPERYSFTWAGKRDCIKLLQVPSRATLIPCPDESIDWGTTNNVFIEGENLEVLKLLYKAYYGRVKMIYIDPPYNTGKDRIYRDDYSDPLRPYLELTGQRDSEGNVLTSNPETSGRYHSAWLSDIYPRLFVARQLLRDDGSIFVSIDDKEVYNLRAAMNEVFGEENFVASIVWQHSVQPKGYADRVSVHHNYILWYRRSDQFEVEPLERTEEHNVNYSNPDNDPRGPWRSGDVRNALYRRHLVFDITTPSGKVIKPPKNGWRWSKETIAKKTASGEIVFSEDETRIIRKIYLSGVQGRAPESIWFGKDVGTTRQAADELKCLFDERCPFDTPKPVGLVDRMLQVALDDGEGIVVDFYAGSCTSADAMYRYNIRSGSAGRYVVAQLQEPVDPESPAGKDALALGMQTVSMVGKERIRRAVAKMKKEQAGKLATDGPQDLGFRVYKLAESNLKPWKGTDEKDPEKYAKTMEMFLDPLVKGWKPEDVIAEVALKEAGFGLNCRVELVQPQMNTDEHRLDSAAKDAKRKQKNGKGPKVFKVTDPDKEQFFYTCLDDEVRLEDLKPLNLTRDVLFVCRDVALDDETAANLALQCRLRTI